MYIYSKVELVFAEALNPTLLEEGSWLLDSRNLSLMNTSLYSRIALN
jgi:hypothetical protein